MRLILITVAVSLPASLAASDPDDGWSNVNRITHDRVYRVLLRDRECLVGSIASANAQQVVVRRENEEDRTIQRAEVLRIADHIPASSHDVVFNGRSSWDDVKAAGPK